MAQDLAATASGLCGLERCTLPHCSTSSQTLCGGTVNWHCGQTFMAGIVSASWLRLIPFLDFDLRLFGTATTRISQLILTCKQPRSRQSPGTVAGGPANPSKELMPGMHGVCVHGTNEKKESTGNRAAKQESLAKFGSLTSRPLVIRRRIAYSCLRHRILDRILTARDFEVFRSVARRVAEPEEIRQDA